MVEAAHTLEDLTVIIVTYNSAHCIDTLAADLAEFPHVFVSDNGSEDGTVQAARAKIPQAKILPHTRNLGFGAANNRALAQVSTPYALLLNPDCEMTGQAALGLLGIMRLDGDAAVVAPQLLDAKGKPTINYRWPSTHWLSGGPGADGDCCVGFVCGAVMLCRMSSLRQVGFFDEDFFLYYEDDDLCLRLFQAKHSLRIAPHIRLRHSSRGSVRGNHPIRAEFTRGYHHAQSKVLFAKKHDSEQSASALRWRTLFLACLGLPLRLFVPIPKHLARHWGRIMGLLQFK